MSHANIQGKLSRAEMKNIMAGSSCSVVCSSGATYWISNIQSCGSRGYYRNNGTYVGLC